MLLTYVAPENLCIAPNAFMAFHAVRSIERGELMVFDTWQTYSMMPPPVQQWIRDNGGWHNLPLNGYWTMHDLRIVGDGLPEMQVRATCCRKMRVRIAHGERNCRLIASVGNPAFTMVFARSQSAVCVLACRAKRRCCDWVVAIGAPLCRPEVGPRQRGKGLTRSPSAPLWMTGHADACWSLCRR